MKILLCLLFCSVLVSAHGYDANEESIKRCEATLKPVAAYVDTFVGQHHRLPTEKEFAADTEKMGWMLVLRDHTYKYTAKQGAKTKLDYMVGIWRSDWFYYYKFWDKTFFDSWHEFE